MYNYKRYVDWCHYRMQLSEGHSEGYQLDLSAAYLNVSTEQRCIHLISTWMLSLNPHAQQFINLSSRLSSRGLNIISRFLHQSADLDSPSLRVTRPLRCTTRLWQVEQSRDRTQTSPSIMFISGICVILQKEDACIPTWQHHFLIHHVLVSQLFWHLMPCIVALTCSIWSQKHHFCRLKGWFISGFCIAVDHYSL